MRGLPEPQRKLVTEAHASALRDKMTCRCLHHRPNVLLSKRSRQRVATPEQHAGSRDADKGRGTAGMQNDQGMGCGIHAVIMPAAASARKKKMADILQRIAQLVHSAACRYPGGITAIAPRLMEDGRAERTVYQDLSPHPRKLGDGRMKPPCPKVADMVRVMEITGNLEPLYALCAHFGMAPTSLNSIEPDAPTVEREMLQDVPSVVRLHEACDRLTAGEGTAEEVLGELDYATNDLRQTVIRTLEEAGLDVRALALRVGKKATGRKRR